MSTLQDVHKKMVFRIIQGDRQETFVTVLNIVRYGSTSPEQIISFVDV